MKENIDVSCLSLSFRNDPSDGRFQHCGTEAAEASTSCIGIFPFFSSSISNRCFTDGRAAYRGIITSLLGEPRQLGLNSSLLGNALIRQETGAQLRRPLARPARQRSAHFRISRGRVFNIIFEILKKYSLSNEMLIVFEHRRFSHPSLVAHSVIVYSRQRSRNQVLLKRNSSRHLCRLIRLLPVQEMPLARNRQPKKQNSERKVSS